MQQGIVLRDVDRGDLETFFRQQLNPAANRMAAFTARDPADRDAFNAHWDRILGDDTVTIKTIVFDENVVGHVASFERSGQPEVTYWIGEEFWGRGFATAALSQFLREVPARPLYARAAKDNYASIRVLEKCGFTFSGHEMGFANARGEEIEEVVMKLG